MIDIKRAHVRVLYNTIRRLCMPPFHCYYLLDRRIGGKERMHARMGEK